MVFILFYTYASALILIPFNAGAISLVIADIATAEFNH